MRGNVKGELRQHRKPSVCFRRTAGPAPQLRRNPPVSTCLPPVLPYPAIRKHNHAGAPHAPEDRPPLRHPHSAPRTASTARFCVPSQKCFTWNNSHFPHSYAIFTRAHRKICRKKIFSPLNLGPLKIVSRETMGAFAIRPAAPSQHIVVARLRRAARRIMTYCARKNNIV